MELLQKPPTWLTDPLPQEARDILNGGGWYAVLGLAALVVLFVCYRLVRAVLPRSRPQPKPRAKGELEEDLAELPPPRHAPGAKRLTYEGLPVRVPLVVLAPAGAARGIDPDAAAG